MQVVLCNTVVFLGSCVQAETEILQKLVKDSYACPNAEIAKLIVHECNTILDPLKPTTGLPQSLEPVKLYHTTFQLLI